MSLKFPKIRSQEKTMHIARKVAVKPQNGFRKKRRRFELFKKRQPMARKVDVKRQRVKKKCSRFRKRRRRVGKSHFNAKVAAEH